MDHFRHYKLHLCSVRWPSDTTSIAIPFAANLGLIWIHLPSATSCWIHWPCTPSCCSAPNTPHLAFPCPLFSTILVRLACSVQSHLCPPSPLVMPLSITHGTRRWCVFPMLLCDMHTFASGHCYMDNVLHSHLPPLWLHRWVDGLREQIAIDTSDEFLTEMSSRQIPSEINPRRGRARHEAIPKQKPSEVPQMNF